MAYVNLWSGIIDSSVWLLPPSHRVVWVTMLAMAEPETGLVCATVDSLARRANVDARDVVAAILTFSAPDAGSRNREHDGRRIAEAPRGWTILNYAFYRDSAAKAPKPRKPRVPRPPVAESDFERFWRIYDRRNNKPKALEQWRMIAPDAALVEKIIAKATAFAATTEQKFRPYPERWLRNRSWDDDLADSRKGPAWDVGDLPFTDPLGENNGG